MSLANAGHYVHLGSSHHVSRYIIRRPPTICRNDGPGQPERSKR